jgi:hypothetical protein
MSRYPVVHPSWDIESGAGYLRQNRPYPDGQEDAAWGLGRLLNLARAQPPWFNSPYGDPTYRLRHVFAHADAISKVWWPKRRRSTRLKDFAVVMARHHRMLKDPAIPDYVKTDWERLPKSGRHYKVTRWQAKEFFDDQVQDMPRDWYLHRDVTGKFVYDCAAAHMGWLLPYLSGAHPLRG